MVGRLLRVTGTVLVIAVAFVAPIVAASAPASADIVIDGCTIVSKPTPTNFTNCPNANLGGADLASLDLAHADLAGAHFVTCAYTDFPAALCTGASLASANLTQANLSVTTLSMCMAFSASFECGAADLSDASLMGADLSQTRAFLNNLTGADVTGANLTDADLGGANMTNTDLTGANLTGTLFSSMLPIANQPIDATLTGATFTDTLLVPSNLSVTATSQDGAVATWPTPQAIPGATPGSCTPASGSTFPLFSSTVTCQVLDDNGDVAAGTFRVNVAPTTQYFTRVLVPSDGAVLAGAPYLDAAAGDPAGVSSVAFEVSGGTLSDHVVSASGPTIFGWLGQWNTTAVPNGTYTLQSVATDGDGNVDTSDPISVTVNNQPPITAMLIPSPAATVAGSSALLDASASSALGISSVTFEVSGGTLRDQVVATGMPTFYGWVAQWNTTMVPNGSYAIQSVATDPFGETATSAPIIVTVNNPPPTTAILIPSGGAALSGRAALLDASASTNVTNVVFQVLEPRVNIVIATATPTLYGWAAQWNTMRVPNEPYTLQSVACYAGGVCGTSPPVTITIDNGQGD